MIEFVARGSGHYAQQSYYSSAFRYIVTRRIDGIQVAASRDPARAVAEHLRSIGKADAEQFTIQFTDAPAGTEPYVSTIGEAIAPIEAASGPGQNDRAPSENISAGGTPHRRLLGA